MGTIIKSNQKAISEKDVITNSQHFLEEILSW
jgi:hypothetical protein